MNNPKVTVMVLSYNYGKYLPRAISSILNQTFQDFEIIIIDDCSTDNTPNIVKGFVDDRIRYFRQPHNVGQAVCRNTAIQHARGDFIATLDADDWWDKSFLEVTIPQFNSDGVGLVYTLKKGHREDGTVIDFPFQKALSGKITNELFISNFIGISIIFRKSVALNGFKTDLCPKWNNMGMDWWFVLEISTKRDIVGIDKPLYNYFIHGKQMSSGVEKRIFADKIIQERFLREFPNVITPKTLEESRFWSYYREGLYLRTSGKKWKSCLSFIRALLMRPRMLLPYKMLTVTLLRG